MFNLSLTPPRKEFSKLKVAAFIIKRRSGGKNNSSPDALNRLINDFATIIFNSKNLLESMLSSYKYSPYRSEFELFAQKYSQAVTDIEKCISTSVLALSENEIADAIKTAERDIKELKGFIRIFKKGRVRL